MIYKNTLALRVGGREAQEFPLRTGHGKHWTPWFPSDWLSRMKVANTPFNTKEAARTLFGNSGPSAISSLAKRCLITMVNSRFFQMFGGELGNERRRNSKSLVGVLFSPVLRWNCRRGSSNRLSSQIPWIVLVQCRAFGDQGRW